LVDIRDRLIQSINEKLLDFEDTLHGLLWKIEQMKQQQAEKEILKFF